MQIRTIFKLLLLPIILGLSASCNNDLDLVNWAKPFPVVFCVVNPCDSFCYVTLSKSFTAEQDVTDILHNNTQSKIDDATILLEAWGKGYKLWETSFSLIQGSQPASENSTIARSCYKSDKQLSFPNLSLNEQFSAKWDYEYFRLQISSPQFDNIAYARVPLIKGPGSIYPDGRMDLSLYGLLDTYFVVRPDPEEIKYASFTCTLYFGEYTDHWTDNKVQFVVKKDLALVLIHGALKIRLYEEFFNQLVAAIPIDPAVFVRRFYYMDFTLISGDIYFDEYYHTYLNVAAHDTRAYTNITNGYGIFSTTRSTLFHPIKFDRQTMDSLLEGRITKHLNFKEW